MNKILFCSLALGVNCAAQAQSSVTIYGTLDNAVTRVTGDGSSRSGLATSGANINRIGFRGSEDLGGGLSAGFGLEAGMNVDTGEGKATGGGLNFNRKAIVSLAHRTLGEIRLGREDSLGYLSTLVFDPFLANGVGGNVIPGMNGSPIQIGNAVTYALPATLGGFHGTVQHAFGEQASNSGSPTQSTKAGNYDGIRFGYIDSQLNTAAAWGQLRGTTTATDVTIANIAVSYDFGVVKPVLILASEKRGTMTLRATELGFSMPVGAGVIRAQVSRYDTRDSNVDWTKFGLGYGYNLSKRTQVYTSIGRISNSAGAQRSIGLQGLAAPGTSLGGKSTGYEVGVRHFF